MPVIKPVSDLRNYGKVLDKVSPGSPVYLTRNGEGIYSIHSIEDDDKYEKANAMVELLSELNKGIRSGEDEDLLTDDEVSEHFRIRREKYLKEHAIEQ